MLTAMITIVNKMILTKTVLNFKFKCLYYFDY